MIVRSLAAEGLLRVFAQGIVVRIGALRTMLHTRVEPDWHFDTPQGDLLSIPEQDWEQLFKDRADTMRRAAVETHL